MKVNSTASNQVQNADVSRVKVTRGSEVKKGDKSSAASGSSAAASAGSVNADISAKGKEFAKAKEIASSAPDIREQKIAALKARIAEGKYKVDANAVADRMVDEHLKTGIG